MKTGPLDDAAGFAALDPQLVLGAYSIGVFPMADSRDADSVYWVEPTERHHNTGTGRVVVCNSTARFGIAYGRFDAPSTELSSMGPFGANAVPAMIDWPTMRCCHAINLPDLSRPAFNVCRYSGR